LSQVAAGTSSTNALYTTITVTLAAKLRVQQLVRCSSATDCLLRCTCIPKSAHTLAGQKLSTRGDSDALHSTLQNALLLQARTYEQFVLYEWYPAQWGAGSASDPLQHSSVVQEVTPSRTGLHSLKSTAVVYRQRGEWEIGG
jgi:hypothetical protein